MARVTKDRLTLGCFHHWKGPDKILHTCRQHLDNDRCVCYCGSVRLDERLLQTVGAKLKRASAAR